MHASKGFSLIEVMVVVAVIGILMAVGIPAFKTYNTNARIRAVTSEIRDGLHTARMEAIRRNNSVSIEISNGGWDIKDSGGNVIRSRTARAQDTALAYTFTPLSGSAVAISSSAKQTLTFSGSGRSSAGGAININQSGTNACKASGGEFACLQISIGTGGVIRSCNPANSSGPDAC